MDYIKSAIESCKKCHGESDWLARIPYRARAKVHLLYTKVCLERKLEKGQDDIDSIDSIDSDIEVCEEALEKCKGCKQEGYPEAYIADKLKILIEE